MQSTMKSKKKVYLGGCLGNWRKDLEAKCPEVEFLDPFSFNQTRMAEFVSKDLELIKNADACLFLIQYKVYSGACVEIGFASALGKPIIIVFKLEDRVDPMMIGCSTGFYTDIEPAIEKLRRVLK